MFRDRFLKKLFMFAFFAALVFPAMLGQLGKINPFNPLGATQQVAPQADPVITETRREHILHGDRTGGGHLYGTGKACKSEFPQGWTGDDVINTVTVLAANDNNDWQQQKNGNYVAEVTHEGLIIRIVLDREMREIVTAYPINGHRNPCGNKPANDN